MNTFHRHFEINDKKDSLEASNIFSVPDFVGDACKAIASRIRGAVASVQFDDFHKVSDHLPASGLVAWCACHLPGLGVSHVGCVFEGLLKEKSFCLTFSLGCFDHIFLLVCTAKSKVSSYLEPECQGVIVLGPPSRRVSLIWKSQVTEHRCSGTLGICVIAIRAPRVKLSLAQIQ